jgi:hypothetical protein
VKAIKMLGLAALMALMAMAFVGASSAMAESTSLCKVDETNCAPENLIQSVHETSVGKAKLLTSIGTTECEVLYSGSVLETGNPLIIKGKFTYTKCKLGESECTATEENGPTKIQVLKEGHETAKVTGEGLVHLVCGKSIDCSYTGTGLIGTAKGPLLSAQVPDNGEVSLSEQATTKEAGGFLCPKTAKLDITTTPLVATYISGATLPLKAVCIEVEDLGKGLYKDSVCTNMTGENTRDGNYELGLVETNLAVNGMACAWVGNNNGLQLTTNLGATECRTSDNPNRVAPYELGTIKTIE